MPYFIALLLLIAPISESTQNASQSVSQANKPGNTRQKTRHKKKVTPPAAPKATESKADEPTVAAPEATESKAGEPTVAASEATESKADQPTLQYNQNYPGETTKPVHNWVDGLDAISTAVVGVFTIVLALATYRQYRATRIAERAWVVCQAPDPPPPNQEGDVAIRWVVENKGRTPAWVTSMGSAARIIKADDALPDEPPYTMAGPFTSEGAVLPPNAKASRGVNIPAANMAAVEHGYEGQEYVLYLFGIVKYRDIFGSEHETRYCFFFKPGPTNLDPAPRDFYVDGPPSYNRAT